MRHRQTRVYLALAWYEPSHIQGINNYASEKNWMLDQYQYWHHNTQGLQQLRPHGIISQLHGGEPDLVKAVEAARVPTVELCNSIPRMRVPRVMPDCEAEGARAAAHLLERGFSRFVYIGYSTMHERQQGFIQAVRTAGCDSLVVNIDDPDLQRDFGKADPASELVHDELSALRRAWARRFFSKCDKPVGVFVQLELWAADIIDGCRAANILVPEQVAVVSMATLLSTGMSWRVPLTVLAPDYEEQGYQAARLLDCMMNGKDVPPDTIIKIPPCPLVPRDSTFCYATDNLQLTKAAICIMRNLHDPELCVKQVCRAAKLYRRALDRAFRHHFKTSVARYIEDLRLKEALHLLETTDATASAIAAQCGFGDLPRFRCAFVRVMGITPSVYRAQQGARLRDKGRSSRGPASGSRCHGAVLPAPVTWRGRQGIPSDSEPKQQQESQQESLKTRVLRLLDKNPLGKKPLSLRLGQKKVSGQLNKIIHVLLADQSMEYTIPCKPNSRLQQYRLTEKGRLLIADR